MSKINSYKEYLTKINAYESYIKLISDPKKRVVNTLIVSGDPGIGKTYETEKFLNKHSKCPFIFVNYAISALALYKIMWENNDAVIVLDDINNILKDKDFKFLLKAATDSTRIRQLNWHKMNPRCVSVNKYNCQTNSQITKRMDTIVCTSNNKRLEKLHEEKNTFPNMFYFTGALIILTNKSLHTIDKTIGFALSNRGNHMEMRLSLEGALDIIKTFGLLMTEYNGIKLKAKTIKETIKFLTSEKAMQYYAKMHKMPTLRTLGKLEVHYQAGMKLDLDILENDTEYAFEDNV